MSEVLNCGMQGSYIRIFTFISAIFQPHVRLKISPNWRSSLRCVENHIFTLRM